MENTNNNSFHQNDNKKPTNKTPFIIAGAIGVIALALAGYFFYQSTEKGNANEKIDTLKTPKDTIAQKSIDSLKIPNEYDEYEESPYSEEIIIAKEITFPTGQKLRFGDKVFVDNEKSNTNEKIVYLNDPIKNPGTLGTPIKIKAEMLIYSYSFDDYKKYFSISPYVNLPASVKKTLLNENKKYKNGSTYELTQNAKRAKHSFAKGDFDGDGSIDYAFLMDNNEGSQESRILIISINKSDNSAYVTYSEYFDDRLIMNSFKKGSFVFMGAENSNLEKTPVDGIMITNGAYSEIAIIFDNLNQKYQIYDQAPANIDGDYY